MSVTKSCAHFLQEYGCNSYIYVKRLYTPHPFCQAREDINHAQCNMCFGCNIHVISDVLYRIQDTFGQGNHEILKSVCRLVALPFFNKMCVSIRACNIQNVIYFVCLLRNSKQCFHCCTAIAAFLNYVFTCAIAQSFNNGAL